ncbi:MAG: LPXTG cell wall anchor domain-containing protein [Actinomycetota bacterium]|nr:LPXTG cell wall anchor domain-containing protein [Actinomycetota bacterium]
MRGFLIVTGMTAMLVIGFASSASAFGPPPGAPTITCDNVSIDPPSVSWISETFSGFINGVAFTRTVSYGAPTPHIASADISDLTTATGPLHITASATWTLGPGSSGTADVTLTCHAAPPVSVEGVTATSAPTTTTTTTMPATTSTTIAPSTATLATDATPPRSSLPLTGASTRPLATTGALAVLAGLAAALGTKRRRKHTA